MTKPEPVSIVMPAFRAETTIAASVKSALTQDFGAFELIIVADDGTDYEAVLGRAGIADPRIRYLESGLVGGGSPPARNKGLEVARYRFSAILDADDRFAPAKLSAAMPHLFEYGLVSCALNVTRPDGRVLRQVGTGPDRLLTPGTYKFTNLSMDSMLVYDRSRADPRFDPGLPCLTDLDFLLKLFATIPACYHLGTPYHDYVKLPVSVSNGPGVTEKMVRTKNAMRSRLAAGYYPLPHARDVAGIDTFLAISLAAEKTYEPATDGEGPALFEDHLEPMLRARCDTAGAEA
ncbi:glycosyltransferase family 2 protein [Pelagibacterium xiamenense]|uniref:glycosyltransferase family 2 protein n=1 Tax=Pelagibacterium xiamenense TaxID=2901140 RepID=UPI001E442DD9|nr:glycosyltransferase family A protein [Pelagibacterium xiamenense]MCD7058563.1 glycosyltransferase family 2 protein [Pelagibacterium xiamenense]